MLVKTEGKQLATAQVTGQVTPTSPIRIYSLVYTRAEINNQQRFGPTGFGPICSDCQLREGTAFLSLFFPWDFQILEENRVSSRSSFLSYGWDQKPYQSVGQPRWQL